MRNAKNTHESEPKERQTIWLRVGTAMLVVMASPVTSMAMLLTHNSEDSGRCDQIRLQRTQLVAFMTSY